MSYYTHEELKAKIATLERELAEEIANHQRTVENWQKDVHGTADEIDRLKLSLSQAWISVSERMPDDEQRVLACWQGSSCIQGMETLIYHAPDDLESGDVWLDVWGELRDPPTHWTIMEMPK